MYQSFLTLVYACQWPFVVLCRINQSINGIVCYIIFILYYNRRRRRTSSDWRVCRQRLQLSQLRYAACGQTNDVQGRIRGILCPHCLLFPLHISTNLRQAKSSTVAEVYAFFGLSGPSFNLWRIIVVVKLGRRF
jgi:hypothetical protein